MPEIVRQLKELKENVPAIRFSEVFLDTAHGQHSYDIMFHVRVDDAHAFKNDYMLHPKHVPVQKFIEARVCGIADVDAVGQA